MSEENLAFTIDVLEMTQNELYWRKTQKSYQTLSEHIGKKFSVAL